mmetsp:Transcript_43436/g.125364  ORF Transcript_43436/g.125364 Transcript_43436/m.125364 type:complete len:553 (-) Transcript_43436:97-1755(-)
MAQEENKRSREPVLGGRRISGTIISWKGTIGWIKPASEIDHPEAELHTGKVFLHRNDVASGANLGMLRGARVNFTVYADGTGLGAQQCRVVTLGEASQGKGEDRGVQKTIGKRQPLGKFAARSRSAPPERVAGKPQPWVRGGAGAAPVAKGKGKGKGKSKDGVREGKGGGRKGAKGGTKGGKGKRKGGPKEQPPRKRIGGRLTGKILRWGRTFGFVEAEEPIEHPAAKKHKGEVFLHEDDVMGGKKPREGDAVDFLPYADRSGLGAEKCRIIVRADGNDEGEEIDELDELEEAEAVAAADALDLEAAEEEEGEEGEEGGELVEAEGEEDLEVAEAEAEAPLEEEEDVAEVVDDDVEEEEPVEQAKGKAKGKTAGQAFARGNEKGKGKSVDSGKGKAASKGKPLGTLGVQKTIEKRPQSGPPLAQVGKGHGGEKGAGPAIVMQSKPKASSAAGGKGAPVAGKAGAGKGAAVGGKAPAVGGKAPVGGKAQAAGGKAGKAAKGSGKSASASVTSSASKGAIGLPMNWEEHWSKEHGVPYFWNRKTKESKWLRPTA